MVVTTTCAGKAHAPPGAETQQIWLKRLGPAGAVGAAPMAVRLRVGFSRLVASPYCSSIYTRSTNLVGRSFSEASMHECD